MSKRDRVDEDVAGPPPKRFRPQSRPPQVVQEIHFARELQEILVFRQDGIQQLWNGIASFKAFLETIVHRKDEDNRGRLVSILREYLESQKPPEGMDLERPFLGQLWQAWSFANKNNNEWLASSISAVMALLLKTLSGILDLRNFGELLGRTALQKQHLRLIHRCLDASQKNKDFLISPALRLLTEISSFDGGILARDVYKLREDTFDSSNITRLLGMVKVDVPEEELARKPAIRTLAMRYALSLMKYLHEGGKIDMLKNRYLCGALFQHIRHDPPDLVNTLLNTVELSVLKDTTLPTSTKAAVLWSRNLERVTEIAARGQDGHPASDKALAWLKAVCTTPGYGGLRSSAWYPPATSTSGKQASRNTIDLGLDSLDFYDRGGPINLRNSNLLSWILMLRGHSNERERELLLACFASAPELIAPYFEGTSLQMEPRLTNTWIGYASLMFEIITLQVPPYLGNTEDEWATLPPQTSIVIENILPKPLNQGVLTRCMNQNRNSDLITFFAVRVLVVAFQKFASILRQLEDRTKETSNSIWTAASERLLQRFVDRCPTMKHVIQAYQRLPDDAEHMIQKEALARLISLYHEVLPSQALEEQFDVSQSLTNALTKGESQTSAISQDSALRALEMEHLLKISQKSTGMKWFTKQGFLEYSPIVALLRIHRRDVSNRRIQSLLLQVLTESNVLKPSTCDGQPPALDALIASVMDLPDDHSAWVLLDDCIGRATRQPIKYLDDLENISNELRGEVTTDSSLPSVLAAVLLEQASFIPAKRDQSQMEWIEILLDLWTKTAEDGPVLRALVESVESIPGWKQSHPAKRHLLKLVTDAKNTKDGTANGISQEKQTNSNEESSLPFEPVPKESQSHPELTRWSQRELDLAVEDGDLDCLILCLCSQHADVRKQAVAQLSKLKRQLHFDSTHENSRQLWLLIGELVETFEQKFLQAGSALPYLAGTFAVRALHIQTRPEHFAYQKLNEFLLRGPEWEVNRLPNYWLSTTMLSIPGHDDTFWREVQWVLDWFVDGLRSTADLDIMRRCRGFEKAMALWSSPGASRHRMIRTRVQELLFRATCIPGGSNVLVAKAGALAWLEVTSGSDPELSNSLRKRIMDTRNSSRIEA